MVSLGTLIQAAGSAVQQDIIPSHNISVRAPATGQSGNTYHLTDVREVSLFVPTGFLVQGQRLINRMPIDFHGDIHIRDEEGGYLIQRSIIAPTITSPALINVRYYSADVTRCNVLGGVNNVILLDSDQEVGLIYNRVVHPLFSEVDRLRGATHPLTFVVRGPEETLELLRRLYDKVRYLPVKVKEAKKGRKKKPCSE